MGAGARGGGYAPSMAWVTVSKSRKVRVLRLGVNCTRMMVCLLWGAR